VLFLVLFTSIGYSQQNNTSDKQIRRLYKTIQDFDKLKEIGKITEAESVSIWNQFLTLATEFPIISSKINEDQKVILNSWISSHQVAYLNAVEYLETKNRFYIFQQ
jgi:hypothetical protein